MPYDVFPHLNPTKLESFRIAYQNKIDDENYSAWLHGKYVLEAIAACFGKNNKYPSVPYGKENNEETSKPISDAERFAIYAMQFNKSKFGKKD